MQIEDLLPQGKKERFFWTFTKSQIWPQKAYSRRKKNTTIFTKWLYILVLKDLLMYFLEVLDATKSDHEAIEVLKSKIQVLYVFLLYFI